MRAGGFEINLVTLGKKAAVMIQLQCRQWTFDSKRYSFIYFHISPFRVICAKRQEKSSLSLHCLCPNSFWENFPQPLLPLQGSFEPFPSERRCTHFSVEGNSTEGQAEPSPRRHRHLSEQKGLLLWMGGMRAALGRAKEDKNWWLPIQLIIKRSATKQNWLRKNQGRK